MQNKYVNVCIHLPHGNVISLYEGRSMIKQSSARTDPVNVAKLIQHAPKSLHSCRIWLFHVVSCCFMLSHPIWNMSQIGTNPPSSFRVNIGFNICWTKKTGMLFWLSHHQPLKHRFEVLNHLVVWSYCNFSSRWTKIVELKWYLILLLQFIAMMFLGSYLFCLTRQDHVIIIL